MPVGVPQPLVSVLTPVFNGEPYLVQAIESVLAQTYTNWEYVLVDNASTDRTAEIIQRYVDKDPRIFRCPVDPLYYPKEGLSYEYPASRLAGKTLQELTASYDRSISTMRRATRGA